MGQDRVTSALARIDAALARLEAAGTRPSADGASADGELDGLREAYRSLRGKVEGAVGELDRLIGERG